MGEDRGSGKAAPGRAGTTHPGSGRPDADRDRAAAAAFLDLWEENLARIARAGLPGNMPAPSAGSGAGAGPPAPAPSPGRPAAGTGTPTVRPGMALAAGSRPTARSAAAALPRTSPPAARSRTGPTPGARAAEDARPAPHRLGAPSPLILHLGAAILAYQNALAAAPRAAAPGFPWAAGLEGAAARLPCPEPVALAAEIARRLAATLDGITAWQTHPHRRSLADPPAIWCHGGARLLDYGRAPEAARPDGPPVLVVPSLINRPYILDLIEGRSLLRWLAARGFRPLLLDWGPPGPEQRGWDMDRHAEERLLPALAAVEAATGRAPALVGYCMGGTLATGLAAQAGGRIAALATIGAPWDHGSTAGIPGGLRAMLRARGHAWLEAQLSMLEEVFGMVPVPAIQALFAAVNPMQAAVKFRRFAALPPDSAAARCFVAVEDWLADGVPMPVPAARDLLIRWQIDNAPALGRWHFLGGVVDPGRIAVPALVIAGRRDSIAPEPVARPLAAAIPGARLVVPATGHVGMIIGTAARRAVWAPLAAFLARAIGQDRLG